MFHDRSSPRVAGSGPREAALRSAKRKAVPLLVVMVALIAAVWIYFGAPAALVASLVVLFQLTTIALIGDLIELRQTYGSGAEAEEKVGECLEELARQEGWEVRHGVLLQEGGDIDHIVAGPRGIFVIETKANRGWTSVEGDRLFLDGKPLTHDPLKQASRNAKLVSRYLKERSGKSYWVTPIVCLPNARIKDDLMKIDRPKGACALKPSRLARYLERFEPEGSYLAKDEVKRISEAIDQLAEDVLT